MGSDIQIGRVHVYVPGGGDRFRQCVRVCVCECLVYPDISLSVQSLMLTLLAASPLHY